MANEALLETIKLNLAESCREMTRNSRGIIQETDGLLLYASAAPDPVPWNGAFQLEPGLSAEAVLQQARSFFNRLERGFSLLALDGPDTGLVTALKAQGLEPQIDSPQMILETPVDIPPLPANTRLQEVGTEAQRQNFLAALAQAYQPLGVSSETWLAVYPNLASLARPHISAWVAYVQDIPAAGAMMYLSHGLAEVVHVGTDPAFQRRGLGDLVSRAVTQAGFERGARLASLQSTPMGLPVYQRIGYREVGRLHWYVFPPVT